MIKLGNILKLLWMIFDNIQSSPLWQYDLSYCDIVTLAGTSRESPLFSEGYCRYLALCLTLSVSQLVSQCVFIFGQCRQTLCDIARLCLMSPMGLWRNSTPFSGAAAFCTTKYDDFRAPLKSVPSPSLQKLSCSCYR